MLQDELLQASCWRQLCTFLLPEPAHWVRYFVMAERKSLSPTGSLYWPLAWSNVPSLHLKTNFIPRKHSSACTLSELGFLFTNLPFVVKYFCREKTAKNVYRAHVCRTTAKTPTFADHQGITKTNWETYLYKLQGRASKALHERHNYIHATPPLTRSRTQAVGRVRMFVTRAAVQHW